MFGRVLLTILLLMEQDFVWSIRLVELRVPAYEREGGVAFLGCEYDMEGETLYSVKWFKDDQEFYRYVPRDYQPNIFYFHTPGVYVNTAASSITQVALVNLTQESAGKYTCAVSADQPSFQYISSEKYMKIYLLPKSGPHVTGLQEHYHYDDNLIVNCTSSASRPAAQLQWLLNDHPVPQERLQGPWWRVSDEHPDAIDSTLQLRFTIKSSDFVNGKMLLKCQATIAPLYQQEINYEFYILTNGTSV